MLLAEAKHRETRDYRAFGGGIFKRTPDGAGAFCRYQFDTISAYGANAAMMHYAPGGESNAVLKPEGFLLVDSGGIIWKVLPILPGILCLVLCQRKKTDIYGCCESKF